jgi:putative xylitol transport system ATP-binding protein
LETPLLEAEGITKSFNGVPALRDGRLTLQRGSVHALCGGNGAGKSTLLNVIMGILRRDSGAIRLNGREVHFNSPADALNNRIAIITQELSPIVGMTVGENIFLGREPRRGIMVDYARLYSDTEALLERLRFNLNARSGMDSLSLAQTQLVEIAKAFSRNSEVLIMDEPTSAIGEREADILFEAIRSVASQGTGIIYVSHRLSEIFTIADSYTVLRDGSFVESGRIADIDRPHLVHAIVGRKVREIGDEGRDIAGEPLLSVTNLSRTGEFEGISLEVRPKEILGVYGLIGSGRSEFMNCVYGLTTPTTGEVKVAGRALPKGQPGRSIKQGVALVTEDRKATGLVPAASVRDNISLAALKRLSRFSVINGRAENSMVGRLVDRLRIKAASTSMAVSSMSGGNQQKVVFSRCLSTEPKLLLCDEPTRGIDEGAKQEIYGFLAEFASRGGAVIAVSEEAQELLQISDRIAVFKAGKVVTIVDRRTTSQEELLHLAS